MKKSNKLSCIVSVVFEDIEYFGTILFSAFFGANILLCNRQEGTIRNRGKKAQELGVVVLLLSKRGKVPTVVTNGIYGVPVADLKLLKIEAPRVFKKAFTASTASTGAQEEQGEEEVTLTSLGELKEALRIAVALSAGGSSNVTE